MKKAFSKPILAWALYDWANSAFATTVMAGFFPIFFKQYWSAGSSTASTLQLGVGNALASLCIVLTAPLLGAIADRGGLRKRLLLLFAASGIAATAALYGVGQGRWLAAIGLYAAATVGFMGANVFYDALIMAVAREEQWDMVSSLGYALGYLGGGLLFAVNVAMTLAPESFGLSGAAEAVRLSFLSVALWWALFSLPLILLVREPPAPHRRRGWAAVRAGYGQLVATFHHVRRLRVVVLFLVAYWLYIDGVDTIVRMAVDYGLSLGLEDKHLITALLITQFVGFPAAMAFGWLGGRWGPKAGILLAIGVYLGVTVFAFFMRTSWEFYVLAVAVGLVQGGIQALSRSLYARLIPADKPAEFFGFYNMLGKFAALLGPLMVGAVTAVSDSHRLGMLSVSLLFVVGAVLLLRVDVAAGERAVRGA
jgi:UMF1 family MFS transporter